MRDKLVIEKIEGQKVVESWEIEVNPRSEQIHDPYWLTKSWHVNGTFRMLRKTWNGIPLDFDWGREWSLEWLKDRVLIHMAKKFSNVKERTLVCLIDINDIEATRIREAYVVAREPYRVNNVIARELFRKNQAEFNSEVISGTIFTEPSDAALEGFIIKADDGRWMESYNLEEVAIPEKNS